MKTLIDEIKSIIAKYKELDLIADGDKLIKETELKEKLSILSGNISSEIHRKMYSEYKKLDASEVISLFKKGKRSRGGFSTKCPFHQQSKVGGFSVKSRTEKNPKGSYHCQVCGATGSVTSLVTSMFNVEFREGVILTSILASILVIGDNDEYIVKELEIPEPEPEHFAELASDDKLHLVYSLFITAAGLSDENKNYLKTIRGLSEEQIKNTGYSNYPDPSIIEGRFGELLKEENLTVEDLIGVPGFYKKALKPYLKLDSPMKVTFLEQEDMILIPIRNARGRICRLQIDAKLKVKKNISDEDKKMKFFWFGSAFANGSYGNYYGTEGTTPKAVIYPKRLQNNKIYVTEGIYKAEFIAEHFGVICISVQGVNTAKDMQRELDEITAAPLFKLLYSEVSGVVGTFDADMFENYNVYKALEKFTDELAEGNENLDISYMYWDCNIAKGIDDLIVEHPNTYREELRYAQKKEFDEVYSKAVEAIMNKLETSKINKIPKEVFGPLMAEELKDYNPSVA